MPNQSFVDLMRRAQHLACLALESDFVKKTEAKLARQSDLLTKAETVVGLGSFEWELSSNKLTWSDHLYKIFGYHESSRPARLDLDFFLSRVHPEDRDEVFAALQEALTNRTGYRNQERIVRPDGEVRIIESFGEVQCDSMGKPTHLAGGCLDITERQELERRLAQSQKMDAIKRLAGGIAHDFNNLLTIITGQAAELMEHGDNPLDKEALGDIWEAGRRAAALTSRLLDFSETKELTATVIDLKVVVRNTLRLARRALSEAITVQESYPDESALISANESQIEQLVFNLLLNAGEAMPEGGRLRIDLSAPVEITTQYHQLKPGTFVELRMQDTGRGIEEELLQKIFEPFSTSKKLGDGRGLGLAVAHGTVCRWGGHIEFLPSVGTGTVVRILFPRVGAAMFETALPATGATHNATATVLVVDDEHAVRRLVEKMLTRSGFKVMQAKNAGDALEIAQKCAFDLLVTDIVMPGMRGDHLARKIRDTMPQIPVLLMSGYAQDGFNVGEPNQDARMRFVSKPFDSDSFLSVVRELLT